LGGQEGRHVARRRIDLAGAGPDEILLLSTGSSDRPALRPVTLHGAVAQVARQRQRGRAHPERTGEPVLHQGRELRVEAAFQCDPQQNHGSIGIEILSPGLMACIRLPGIQEADKLRERVLPSMRAFVLLRHARQSGRMAGKLPQRHPPDITAPLQLGNVFGDRVIEAELALLDGLRKQRGREKFADRGQVEDRIARDSAILRGVGEAVVEELALAIHPDRDRNASSAAFRQYRLNLLRDDLFNIDLSACRLGTQ